MIVRLRFFDDNVQAGFQRRNGKPGNYNIIVLGDSSDVATLAVIASTILIDCFGVGRNIKDGIADFMLAKPNIVHPRFFQAFNVDAWNRL